MMRSHITEHTHKYQAPIPPELSNVASNKPQTYNSLQNYQLDSLNKFKDSNILLKTNNVTCTTDTDLLSQENQNYYNQRDQQCITRKHNGGLQRVTIELVPNIILEVEEGDGFKQ